MKQTQLILAFLGAASLAGAAPAPVYKERPSLETAHRALPKALRDEIERNVPECLELVESYSLCAKRARIQKEKDAYLRTAEKWKAQQYRYPIDHLEYQRKQPEYQSRDDQQKIDVALKYYRLQYEDVKKKGLIEVPNFKK